MSELTKSPAPPVLLLAALVLITIALIAAGIGAGDSRDLRSTLAAPVSERALVFLGDVSGGELTVIDAATDKVIETIPAGESTFIRGMLRGIGRERQVKGISAEVPLLLSAREDGSVTVVDEGTGIVYDLRAFGRDNVREFGRLLAEPGADRLAGGGGTDNLHTSIQAPAQ